MAREQRLEERQRLQVTAQETFDFTTPDIQVVTRPTDPYVRPAAGRGWQQLAQALSSLNPALQAYGEYEVRQYERDLEAGHLARATGQEKPSESIGMIRGWEMLDGIYKAIEYKKEINQFYAQNYASLSPEELAEGLDEIERRYLEGMTEWQQRGFVERSIPAREQVEMAYINSQSQLLKQEALDKLSQKAYDDVHSAILKGIEEAGLSPEEAAGNPFFYEIMLDDKTRKNLASYLRSVITVTQNGIGKDLNLTKNEVGALYVQQMGELAVELGLPELLDAAYIKESGVSLEGSTLGDQVRRYRERAEKARETYIDAWTKRQTEIEKQRQNELMIKTHHVLAQLTLMEDRMMAAQEAYKWMNTMAEDPLFLSLDEADHAKLLNGFRDIAAGEFLFPETSNDYLFIDLKAKGINGTLTWQDVSEAISEGELSRSDAEELMEMVGRIEALKEENAGKLPPWPDEKFIRPYQQSIIDYLGEKNMFGVFENGLDATAAEGMFTDQVYRFLMEHGRFPTYSEWKEQIAEPILSYFETSFKEIYTSAGPSSPHPDFSQNLTRTEKRNAPWWQFWNWNRTDTVELPFTYDNELIFNTLDELFSSGVTVDSLRQSIVGGEGTGTIQTLRQVLEQAGDPEIVLQGFLDNYRYSVADFFLNHSGDDPITAHGKIKTLLEYIGFNNQEINEAVQWARYKASQGGMGLDAGGT